MNAINARFINKQMLIILFQILAIIKMIDKWVNIHMYLLFRVNNLMLMRLPYMAAVHKVQTVKILTERFD